MTDTFSFYLIPIFIEDLRRKMLASLGKSQKPSVLEIDRQRRNQRPIQDNKGHSQKFFLNTAGQL